MTVIHNFKNLFLHTIFLFVLTFPISGAYAQANDPDKIKQFEDAILRGEDFLKAKDYARAKAEYQKAMIIDPAAKYPKDKLAYIRKFYIDPEDEARFLKAMETGNQLLTAKNYQGALGQFESAVNIKPEDKNARENMAKAEKLASEQLVTDKQYVKLIADADKSYAAKEMTSARAAYAEASKLKPDENYPRQRIGEIDAKAEAEKSLNETYDKANTEADEAYMNRDFTTAKLKYELALKIKPGENYPKSMLERVSQGMSQQKDAQQSFREAVASADKLFNNKDYETALLAYQNAAKILPAEKYPPQQIEIINAIIEQMQNLEASYSKIISAGNQFFEAKQYQEARSEFQKANDLKPGEAYPKQKIEEIALLLLALKDAERDKSYTTVIAAADQFYDSKDFDNALAKYREAEVLKADETYPKTRIGLINQLLSQQQAASSAYEKAIVDADLNFSSAKYAESIEFYQTAQQLKPEEIYPAQQIAKAQEAIIAFNQKEESYRKVIAIADELMNSGNYDESLINYREALVIKPGSSYPQEQILKIEATLSANRSLEEQYQKLIVDGDRLYRENAYTDAVQAYTQALEIKSQEKYPSDQIAKINGIVEMQQAQQLVYNQQIALADKLYNEADYQGALAKYNEALESLPSEKYPQEKISAINSILEQQKSLEENFAKNISEGDLAYKANDLENALSLYEKARALKPEMAYPISQIALIDKALSGQKALNTNFTQIIAEADRLFNAADFMPALEKYKEARTLKPEETYPQTRIDAINNLISKNKETDEAYRVAVAEGDRLFGVKELDQALVSYRVAQNLKPAEVFPGQQIDKINALKGEYLQAEQQYTETLGRADRFFTSGAYTEAESAYREALILKPAEKYPVDQIALIAQKKSELQTVDENYRTAVAEGDRLYELKEYREALVAYNNAIFLKPGESHPRDRISTIGSILDEQKSLADKDYNDAIESANRMFTLQDYTSAIKSYETASAIKPSETYPKNKLLEINAILMERSRNQADAYNKIIIKADLAYQEKIFDQAIYAYEEAKIAKPDEAYPGKMIDKIRQYMEEHSMVDLVSEPILIAADTEQKFKFNAIEMRLRKNNYIIIKARKTGEFEPKVYLNYGIDGQKSGGIVLRSIKSQETGDYIVRVSIQDRWYRVDNNWVSVYSEGGEVEISKMQISQGD